jgi:hypothetical protein
MITYNLLPLWQDVNFRTLDNISDEFPFIQWSFGESLLWQWHAIGKSQNNGDNKQMTNAARTKGIFMCQFESSNSPDNLIVEINNKFKNSLLIAKIKDHSR